MLGLRFEKHLMQKKKLGGQRRPGYKSKSSNNKNSSKVKQESYSQFHDTITPMLLCKELGGFPSVYKWRYSVSATNVVMPLSVNPSTGITWGFNFPHNRLNLGWANLTGPYNSYVITSSFARVMAVNKSAATSYRVTSTPINAALLLGLPLPTDDRFVTSPFSQSRIVTPIGSGPNMVNIESGFPVNKVAGLSRPVDQFADAYSGYTGSANSVQVYTLPANDYYWNFTIQSLDGTAIPANTVFMSLVVIYDVLFFDRLPVY